MTIQCCVCKKTQVNGEWRQAKPEAEQDVSHTYCPVCLDETIAEITAYKAMQKPITRLATA